MDPTEVTFEYICRRCREKVKGSQTSFDNGNLLLGDAIYLLGYEGHRVWPRPPLAPMLWDVHACADGGRGITDLIGHTPPGQK